MTLREEFAAFQQLFHQSSENRQRGQEIDHVLRQENPDLQWKVYLHDPEVLPAQAFQNDSADLCAIGPWDEHSVYMSLDWKTRPENFQDPNAPRKEQLQFYLALREHFEENHPFAHIPNPREWAKGVVRERYPNLSGEPFDWKVKQLLNTKAVVLFQTNILLQENGRWRINHANDGAPNHRGHISVARAAKNNAPRITYPDLDPLFAAYLWKSDITNRSATCTEAEIFDLIRKLGTLLQKDIRRDQSNL